MISIQFYLAHPMPISGISYYDDNDFDEGGLMILDATLQKDLEGNDMKSIMSIQSFHLGI